MDMKVFFASVRKSLFRGKLTQKQVEGIERLIGAWDRWGTGLDTGLAYVLETSRHETGGRMQPVRETFATSTQQAINRLENAWKNGKLPWVRTPYWRQGWFGRGDVQLTHEANYRGDLRDAVLEKFGVDIHANPDKVLDPEISAFIIVEGMTRGKTTKADFTTHALEDFVNEHMTDYANARKVVNPGEKSTYEPMAANARLWEDAIREAREAAGEPFRGPTEERNLYDGRSYPEVRAVQERLDALGYPEVGAFDGRWGSKTRAAVLAFRADNELPLKPVIDQELLARLMTAEGRPQSTERKEATVEDLREVGAEDVKAADKNEIGGIVAVGGGSLVGLGKVLEYFEDYSGTIRSVAESLAPVQTFVQDNFWLLLLGVGGYVIYQSGVLKSIRLEKHRTGQDVSE